MRSFRKPGRYKRNLHSTYCREHPLVKSLSNIYSCLLKGLSLIAREVSPKKRNNIPFITSNFRKKGSGARLLLALLLSLLIIVSYSNNSLNDLYFLRFQIHHGTFPSVHFIIRSFVIRHRFFRSIFIFSPLLYPLFDPSSFFSFSTSKKLGSSPSMFSTILSTNLNVAVFLIIPTYGGIYNWRQVEARKFLLLARDRYNSRNLFPTDH